MRLSLADLRQNQMKELINKLQFDNDFIVKLGLIDEIEINLQGLFLDHHLQIETQLQNAETSLNDFIQRALHQRQPDQHLSTLRIIQASWQTDEGHQFVTGLLSALQVVETETQTETETHPFEKIDHVALVFKQSNFLDSSFYMMNSSLQYFSLSQNALSKLSLDFSRNKFTWVGFSLLCKTISNCAFLRGFTLNISHNENLSVDSVCLLIQSLPVSLTDLIFKFSFLGQVNLEDAKMYRKILLADLVKLKSLSQLRLCFAQLQYKVTSQIMSAFLDVMQDLPALQHLIIMPLKYIQKQQQLQQSSKKADMRFFQALGQLQQLKRMQYTYINLANGCKAVLEEQLCKLISLNEFTLLRIPNESIIISLLEKLLLLKQIASLHLSQSGIEIDLELAQQFKQSYEEASVNIDMKRVKLSMEIKGNFSLWPHLIQDSSISSLHLTLKYSNIGSFEEDLRIFNKHMNNANCLQNLHCFNMYFIISHDRPYSASSSTQDSSDNAQYLTHLKRSIHQNMAMFVISRPQLKHCHQCVHFSYAEDAFRAYSDNIETQTYSQILQNEFICLQKGIALGDTFYSNNEFWNFLQDSDGCLVTFSFQFIINVIRDRQNKLVQDQPNQDKIALFLKRRNIMRVQCCALFNRLRVQQNCFSKLQILVDIAKEIDNFSK